LRFVCSIPAGVVRDARFQKDLAMFYKMPPQFILWKSVSQMPPAKPRKVPCDATGQPTNHLDPDGFMTYEEAVSVAEQGGFFVGFVLTDKDPYFLFDLDDVRDPVSGAWDAESKMLQGAGSMAVQFGDKASARDLWTADVVKLSQFFPSPGGDAFDHSSADAALMAHLAFWTGKDYQRMQKLFEGSGLMRDKFKNRPDYRMNTITGAIAGCRNVYSVANKPATPAALSSELMTVHDQQKYFEGVVYVADRNEVMLAHGGFIKPQAFRARFGGYEFLIGQDKRPTTNAFEALTENRIIRQTKADTTTYRPDLPFGQIINDAGVLAVNVYKPPHTDPAPVVAPDDAKPFLDLIAVNFPDSEDQAILLDWLAWVIQNPGKIARWSPVLQGTHGCGKGLISRAVQYCVGDDHTAIVTPENLADNFNGYLVDRCLIAVDEIGEHSKKSLIEISERLKPLISDTRISIRAMRRDARTMPNTSNWFFTTNYLGSMFADDPRERRWCPFVSALQTPADLPAAAFYGDYVKWFDNGGNEVVRGFLAHRVVTDFPNRAPVTTSTEMARDAAESDIVRLIREMVRDDAMGFRDGFLSSTALRIAIREEGLSEPKGRWFADHVRRAGFPESFRSRNPILAESFHLPGYDPSRDSTTRVTIYHTPDNDGSVTAYLAAQRFPETPKIGTSMTEILHVR